MKLYNDDTATKNIMNALTIERCESYIRSARAILHLNRKEEPESDQINKIHHILCLLANDLDYLKRQSMEA